MISPQTGDWVFPCEFAEESLVKDVDFTLEKTNVVYNFVLQACDGKGNSYLDLVDSATSLSDHSMVINGVPVVTFGHGLETNHVVKHAYWGNMRAMLRDL